MGKKDNRFSEAATKSKFGPLPELKPHLEQQPEEEMGLFERLRESSMQGQSVSVEQLEGG